MNIPKVPREHIGHFYMGGMILAILGIMADSSLFGIVGILLLLWTLISDDENNHFDPPGTQYMDRNGHPIGGDDIEPVS